MCAVRLGGPQLDEDTTTVGTSTAEAMRFDPDHRYVRHPLATALTTGDRVLFTRPGAPAHCCSIVASRSASELWAALATPIDGSTLAGHPHIPGESVASFVESLLAAAFVIRWEEIRVDASAAGAGPLPAPRRCRSLVLGITGAAQAVFAPALVERLVRCFTEQLDVVLTRSARRLLQPRARTLLGARVWSDPFATSPTGGVPHIDLATGTDAVLVMPASAAAISRLAHGACSDLLSLVVTATRAPVIVVPSMNPAMWHHPATRRNVQQLREDGAFVVEPGLAVSAASGAADQMGGPGLGPDDANLIAALDAVMELNR